MNRLSKKITLVLSSAVLLSLSTLVLKSQSLRAEVQPYPERITIEQLNNNYAEQQTCMALNIYHEARAESKLGQRAVGFVTLNRVHDKRYPSTICDVVYDAHVDSSGNPIRNKCQFSWYCDGRSDTPHDKIHWEKALEIASDVIYMYGNIEDFTEGATMYHASYVNPYWASSYEKTVRIDAHIFYK